ncbi:MAG: transposase [bacterium]|nr:transposase [bacterium]
MRELKALIKYDKESWASEMYFFLLATNSLVRQAKKKGVQALDLPLLLCIGELCDNIVEAGLAFFHRSLPAIEKSKRGGRRKRRPGHNLVRRLRDFKADALRFAYDFHVPFTNNLAEQDIHMMKVRMKISDGFRSAKGAQVFIAVRSVISTTRKQGWNILATLSVKPDGLIQKLKIAG